MRPQGELVPRLCAAIMASTPRSGAAVDRGASVPVSGFQQTQLVHIADSVLCDGSNKSSKGDNTWLGVAADVWRGRSIARNPWGAPPGSQEKFAVVHIAGNDFKTRGGARVKPWLDESFWDVFKEKMLLLRGETKGVFLVVWGDYQLWAPGFNDEQATSAAARYNGMCAEMLQRATQLDIPSRWLRSEDPPRTTPGTLLAALRQSCGNFSTACWIPDSLVTLLRMARTDRLHRDPRRLCADFNSAHSCWKDSCLHNTTSPRCHLLHKGQH